ncbi:hypothetical protein SLE2022_097460 [Rubroshorea leprosula]
MKRDESSFSPVALLFLLLMFLSIVTVRGRTLCSSVCGNITNIRHPFRLEGDPPDCGNIGYQLSCENKKTILNFNSGKYYVKKIDYEESIIRLVDVNLANGSCSLPYFSLSMGEVLWDGRYIVILTNRQVDFLNCSKDLTDPAYTRVPCLSGNAQHVFVSISDYFFLPDGIPESCVSTSAVPTIYDESKKNLSYETISKILEDGFDLGWTDGCWGCWSTGGDYYAIWEIILYLIVAFLRGIILIVRFILLPLVVFGFILHKYITTRKKNKNVDNFVQSRQLGTPKRYSYTDIISMTNNFKNKLGKGGFGSVYMGQLLDGCLVSVKLLETLKVNEENFINEVARIGGICHYNVVQLVGFCSEGSKLALVCEYMPNGSLEKYIFSRRGKAHKFSWEKLQEIALGMAKGIEFLHRGSDECILHFDIKPENILLDQNFTPKIAAFSLAKFYAKSDFVSMRATEGTMGYMAPELISRDFGDVSSKSDVYSFGILLLEMASERRNVDMGSSNAFFPSWAYDQLDERGEIELGTVADSEAITVKKLLIIGLWCTQVKASDRPSMSRVVEILQGSINELKMPPRPSLSTPQYVSLREPLSDSPKELLIPESMERSS